MAAQISNLRLFLHGISDELVTEELKQLKFLCSDILTKRKLENIENARELFVAIGEVTEGEDKQLDLLKQLFKSISRIDLARQVEQFQQSRKGAVNTNSTQTPLQPNLNTHNVVPNDQVPTTLQPGSLGWPPQGRQGPVSHQIAHNLLPHQTGQPSLYGNAGIQHATDSLPNTETYRESRPASVSNLLRDKPSEQPTSEVWPQHANQHSGYSTADAVPSYPVQHSSFLAVNQAAVVHPAGSISNPEEQFKTPSEQDSAWKYQSQQSVPFGQQEQSSYVNKEEENAQWEEEIEPVQLPDPLQSSPSSFSMINTQCKDEKVKLVDLSDPLHSSPSSSNAVMDTQWKDDKPLGLADLPQSETNQGMSGDSGHNNFSVNSQEKEAENGALDSSDHPGGHGRSSTDGGSTANTSSGDQRISQPRAEKVPVERVMSNDIDVEDAQHLHHKCPVEMSYKCISRYFNSGGKNLGKGGFGTVYEGTCRFRGQSVVVKEEYSSHLGQAYSAAQLKREKRVGYIKHPHLMPLYAFCEEKGKPRCLMYPKMHSDLHKALRRDLKKQEKLPWEYRVRIALHTARALLYLHTEVTNERNVRQEIVHMDVKPGNVFLDEDFNARLGDPGMAQELPMEFSYASISQIRGTEGYMDEYLQDRHFKPVNDIFAFGVVLLQLLTQREAVERKPGDKNVPLCRVLKNEGVLADPEGLMKKTQKDVWPDSENGKSYTKEFAAIAIECLKKPDERARLTDVCQRLEEILERRGVSKASKPKEGARCVSCLLNDPAKHLGVRSAGCGRDATQECNYFCMTCLTQARRNPLECPSHGPAEPPIGGSDTYAVLVCGNDPYSSKAAAVFERDLIGFKSVLTDSRIVGVRNDHLFSITPSSSCGPSQAAQVRQALQELQKLLQGKKDVFLYFYFSGHSDQSGNLLCLSENDLLTEAELKEHFRHLNASEFLIILDCCYADGKITSEHIDDESFLVNKSPVEPAGLESRQYPLESLYTNLQKTGAGEDFVVPRKEPISNVTEDLPETDFDTLDGNVFNKAPLVFTVRQWSSSLSQQESYAKAKGSFLTQFIICGLRGARECPFSNCSSCDRFKAKAKSLGYISAANLEDFISKHVEKAASRAGGRHQNPRMRTVHSKETLLAFYSDEVLRDDIMFKSPSSGLTERITVDKFPILLLEFQKLVFSKVQGHLPNCAQPKHLQILCDDQEIDATSYVDLQEFLRQGYDVRCQLRPCSGIVQGPVLVQIQNYKDQVITLLTSLQLTRNLQQHLDTFQLDTSQKSCTAEDVRECCDEHPSLSDLKDTTVANSIVMILTEVSLYPGCLTVCVLDESMDCCFCAQALD